MGNGIILIFNVKSQINMKTRVKYLDGLAGLLICYMMLNHIGECKINCVRL